MLTRMRQLALHPGLVPANYLERLRVSASDDHDEHSTQNIVPVSPEDRARLQGILSQFIEDCEECPICMGVLDNPRITPCAHPFCLAWYHAFTNVANLLSN